MVILTLSSAKGRIRFTGPPQHPRNTMRRATTICLLLLATAHCVLSIFADNISYLDLPQYAAGLSPLPFQHRLLMIPFVRWAESVGWLQSLATRYARNIPQTEPMSAAKLGCLLLGMVMVATIGAATMLLARRLGVRHRWLPWALLLVILYASYAARYEQALWYPYDLPHLAVFGAATLFLLLDRPAPFLACLTVDVFLRETSIFLVLLALVLYIRSTVWRWIALTGAVLWGFGRWLAHHLYPANPYRWNAVPWLRMAAPEHWPQLFSIVGFFWIPVWLCRRYLTPRQRLALYAASAMMLASFYFATWNETRVWVEWSVLFAVLAACELEAGFAAAAPRAAAVQL
jgi:hypothetical protein